MIRHWCSYHIWSSRWIKFNCFIVIRSWILFFRAQHWSVSCPGLLEWYAHLAFGLYLGDEMFGLDGGSHNVTKSAFNKCCKAYDSDMLILVNCLRGTLDLWLLDDCLWADWGLEINTTLTEDRGSFLVHALTPYTTFVSFFPVKGLFKILDAEANVMRIFPLLMPFSTLSPVRINSMKPCEELPINRLKMGPLTYPWACQLVLSQLVVVGPY